MPNPPRKRSWKDAAQTPKPRSVEEPWRKSGPVRSDAPWWKTRKARIGFLAAALLLVTAIIIVVAELIRPVKEMQLVLIVPDYKTNLFVPANVPGSNGGKELEQIHLNKKWGDSVSVPLDNPKAIEEALSVHLLEKAPKKIVVFVSAHGVARYEKGDWVPYLVHQDYPLHEQTALYPLDNLLNALANSKLENTQKLLLLDVTPVSAHWPLGELHNDFATALANRKEQIQNIKNLVVISSSGKDQRSWVSPEWSQSYFAHYVLEGLKGAADGVGSSSRNDRVDALELFNYVSREVQHWAWNNRAKVQTPVMLPKNDDKRARNMELVHCGEYKEASKLTPDALQDKNKVLDDKLDDLKKAWQACQELRDGSPHPAVYAPHLWRRYLDTLLRAEQLLRAGDTETASKLLADSSNLHQDLEKSRSMQLSSAQLTLGMAAAANVNLTKSERDKLRNTIGLWQKDGATKDGALKDWDKESQLLRAALAGRVMQSLAETPEKLQHYDPRFLENLDKLGAECRPAEVHYLMMLRPLLDEKQPSPIDPLLKQNRWPLVRKSLQVRLVAEQAALGLNNEKTTEKLPAYSEQVLPWLQAAVEEADHKRRLGQDYLFTSNPKKEWDEAERLLTEAGKEYGEIQEWAVKLRQALEVRDRVYSELPYYTHWIAEVGTEQDETFAIDLWAKLHKLDEQLDKPASGKEEIGKQVGELDALRGRIASDVETLTNRVFANARKEKVITQVRWHEIEAALAVPFLPVGMRLNRIKDSRDISAELYLNTTEDAKAPNPDAETEEKQARENALRQGRLALAVLGESWRESKTIRGQVENASDKREENWRKFLTLAGEDVGKLLNNLPAEADKKCADAAKSDDLKKAEQELRSAAREARILNGAAATLMTQQPVEDKRHLEWHNLLCWQAHRTYLDWWAELPKEPPARPYYQRAGGIFLDDAAKLVMGKETQANPAVPSPRLSRVNAEAANLRRSDAFLVERSERGSKDDFRSGPANFALTDEDMLDWWYRLRGPNENAVPGHPVVWVTDPKGGLRVEAGDAQRRPIRFDTAFEVKSTPVTLAARPRSGIAQHTVEGFFRGHRSQVQTSVAMKIKPDRVVSLPPESLWEYGHVAVQTKKSLYDVYGAKNAAIALVLDLSGSMTSIAPGDNTRTPRYKKAIKALEKVLKELPEDVTVSLLVFGADPFQQYTHQDGIEMIWEPHPWHKDDLEKRMSVVRKLNPKYTTPLIRSIWMASKEKLLPRKLTRSIVAITDGGDSNFYSRDEDLRGNKDISIKGFLQQEFGESDIKISVIGYEVNYATLNADEKRGYREFKPALKAINGQYFDAENDEQLIDYLMRSLLHMYFQVYPDIGQEAVDWRDKGHYISQSDKEKTLHWVPLKPGTYRIGIPSISMRRQRIEVRPGDALLLDIVRGELGGRPEFSRGIYAKSDFITREHSRIKTDESQKDWLLGVLQNYQPLQSEKLQLMATLEQTDKTRLSEYVQQIHPRWVWFDVAPPADIKATTTLRITSLPHYPADSWGIEVSGWPLDCPIPTLKTWWIVNSPRGRTRLIQGADFDTLLDLRPRSWISDPQLGQVVLENIELKKLDIDVEKRTHKDVNCLVVRLKYPPGKDPFFVRLSDNQDRKIGVEDRFYTEAGKYTGIFWPVTKDNVPNVERLTLFSVADLKKTTATRHVEKLELLHPADSFQRPLPAR